MQIQNYLDEGSVKNVVHSSAQPNNALVTLAKGVDVNNNVVYQDYEVNFYSITMTLNTSFTSPQLQKGIAWSPLRVLGSFGFTIRWASQTIQPGVPTDPNNPFNYNGFKKMNEFHNSLRYHQKLAATTGKKATPMRVLFYNNTGPRPNPLVDHNLPLSPPDTNLTLEPIEKYGFITVGKKEYDRFKTFYEVDYQLELTVPQTQPFAFTTPSEQNNYILPTATTVLEQGPKWTNANITLNIGINIDGISN